MATQPIKKAKSIRCALACSSGTRSGFTLVEMSLVLVIIGMIILIVFPALQAVRKSTQQSLTNSNLGTLLRASAAFTHANGCLPCPTPAGTTGSGFGHVRGDTVSYLCGDCAVAEGIVPFASLGIPAATAKDGWGRWITMRIDPALAINFGIVPPTAACTASDPQPCLLDASQKGLCQAGLSTAEHMTVSNVGGSSIPAAILFLSHGPNGYGAYKASALNMGQTNAHNYQGPATACSAYGGFELCNADDDANFADAPRNNKSNAPFDDFLVYMDRNSFIASLGSGVCQTVW